MSKGKSLNTKRRADLLRNYAKNGATAARRGWRPKTYERQAYDGRDAGDIEGGDND
jgi:hypothetical protein